MLDNVQWFEVLKGKQGKSLAALELMGLGRLADEKAKMMSMRQRKRLQLARLLAIDRPIWLLDEPSIALDDEGVKLLEYIIAEDIKERWDRDCGYPPVDWDRGGCVIEAASKVSEENDLCRYP